MNNEPDYKDNLYFEGKKMQKTPEVGDGGLTDIRERFWLLMCMT